MNVDEPIFSMIWNGPSHIFWNFVCLPLSSCSLSHFKKRSPICNVLDPVELASKEDFISCWCLAWMILGFSLSSSNLRIWSNFNWTEDEGFSLINCTSARDGSARFEGITTYFSYTRLKGEVPIEDF